MIRPILAGAAGFACWTVLWLTEVQIVLALLPGSSTATEPVLETPALLALLACAIANSVAAGAVTSALAQRRSRPVWGLGLALLAFGAFVQISNWELQPVWYHLVFLAALVPATLLGRTFTPRPKAAGAMPAAG